MQTKIELLKEIKTFARDNEISFSEALSFYQIYSLRTLEKCISDSLSDLASVIEVK
ncbi:MULTISPECIES: hypothetical protein [Nostocaceae]|uniref:hypothetical protein n=1 Tax=Nostocaceae TaxID=1162 RepID=UPI001EDCD039|nr:hypothetical protein [Nostoc sp. UHCC 0870]UKP01608.1 hypothetical protein L6494_30750 [Nostoc sp. UHCC 0870]